MHETEPDDFFGEVISCYTLEEAIEDGLHIDFGYLFYGSPSGIRIIMTSGVLAELNKNQLIHALIKTLNGLTARRTVDMVVFKTKPVQIRLDDEERTYITHIDGLKKKVYAKKDGQVITIMLAEEY